MKFDRTILRGFFLVVFTLTFSCFFIAEAAVKSVVVGSKKDTEGRVLGEIFAQLLEDRGFTVDRRLGLGGTLICFEALKNKDIDVYPEYTGTLEQAILKLTRSVSLTALRDMVQRNLGMELLRPLGFNNTYAIAISRDVAARYQLKTVGDLAKVQGMRFGFSHEFLSRQDGWPGLSRIYGLSAKPTGLEHGLAYQAIAEDKMDATDAYSTDGQLMKFDLVLLKDDRNFFPQYLAAPLVEGDVSADVKRVLNELANILTDDEMQRLNAMAELEGKDFSEIAHSFLVSKGLLQHAWHDGASGRWSMLFLRTMTHIKLTLAALLAAIVIAIPLGALLYRLRSVARPVIAIVGILQTIPSIALLGFMIPLFGIGVLPAIVALFLYALLPILRNTVAALISTDPVLRKVSVGMGLTAWQRLRYVELPLAMPMIAAGVRTAAVISIGTATLAAFIGAGGLGEPIVTGLALNDTGLILEGAIPAAVLAIVTELGFEYTERVLIPKHLLQKVTG